MLSVKRNLVFIGAAACLAPLTIVHGEDASSSLIINQIEAQQREIDALKNKLDELSSTINSTNKQNSDSTSTEEKDAQRPVGQAPPKPSGPQQAADIIQQQAILTRKGTVIIEPSISYSYSSVQRVALEGFTIIPAITIGSIEIKEVDRNTAIGALSLRYGFTNRFEFGVKVPYVQRSDSTVSRPFAIGSQEDTLTKAQGDGVGDIEMSLNYMFNNIADGGPYFVGSIQTKARNGSTPFDIDVDPSTGLQATLPTGTGFRSIHYSLGISYPSDPAVFFGSISYLKNIEREISPNTGTITPGNAAGISFGMAFAINPKASFSLGYSHNNVAETKQNDVTLPGSTRLHIGTLLFGLSHRMGKSKSLNISLGAGVTDDSPDIQLSFRLPVSFSILDS